MTRPPVAVLRVAAGVLHRDGQLLVSRRRAHDTHAGKWEFPGGKAEAGETLAECMRRELEEELGIAAAVGDVVWRTVAGAAGRRIDITFFSIPRFAPEPTGLASAELRWVGKGELATLDFIDADREFVTAVLAGHAGLLAVRGTPR